MDNPQQRPAPARELDLYNIYAAWTGQLHHYCVKELGQDLNVEFFPAPIWEMRLYPPGSLRPKQIDFFSTVPGYTRPADARPFRLPRPEADPSQMELDQTFRALCYAAALCLKIDLGKRKLSDGMGPENSSPARRQLDES